MKLRNHYQLKLVQLDLKLIKVRMYICLAAVHKSKWLCHLQNA
ncbi:Uncharacterised protein [Enterobacter hormaechei]|nr:Uncharacterised protein [Enterobacter hormaechei]